MYNFKILEYALALLLRRPGKNFSILIVYTLIIAVLASVLFLTQSLKFEATTMLAGAPDLIVQKKQGGRHDLITVESINKLAVIPGVNTVEPRIWGYYYDALIGANYTLQTSHTMNKELTLLNGRLPQEDWECAIGSGVAELRRVSLGEDLILVDHDNIGRLLLVTGIFEPAADLLTLDLVVMPETTLREFFGIDGSLATDLAVSLFESADIDEIGTSVGQILPGTRVITKSDVLRTYLTIFDWRSGMMQALFSSALIAFFILAWDKLTGISAAERQEIGILRAVGWPSGLILQLKIWEGLIVSLLAFLLGSIIAFLLVFFFEAPLLSNLLRGWSVLFPVLRVTPFIDLFQVSLLALLTITPYVASVVIPSWRLARKDPDVVMR